MAVAWYTAAFTRQEKQRPLREVLAVLDAPGKQTPAEQRAILMGIAAKAGLKIRVKES